MPNYQYCCNNKNCTEYEEVVIITKKMSESDRKEFCTKCNEPLSRTIESLVCGYTNTKGFFGKAGQHD